MRCVGLAEPERAASLMQAGADHVIDHFVGFSVTEVQKLFA
jgi:hypothetical protein